MMTIEDVETDGDAHEEVSDGIVQVDMTFKLLARRLSGGNWERAAIQSQLRSRRIIASDFPAKTEFSHIRL